MLEPRTVAVAFPPYPRTSHYRTLAPAPSHHRTSHRRTLRMPIETGAEIVVEIEKPAVGGRMLARHDGQVVLVWGAIPGERVRARVERSGKGVLFAESMEVMVPSADRREPGADWRCGGNVFNHIAYERQLRLKAEIIRDSLGRIGRVPLSGLPDVLPSPERGYRMRARLHARDGHLGFFREGSHQLCDAGPTGQLLSSTVDWIDAVERTIADMRLSDPRKIAPDVPAELERAGGVRDGAVPGQEYEEAEHGERDGERPVHAHGISEEADELAEHTPHDVTNPHHRVHAPVIVADHAAVGQCHSHSPFLGGRGHGDRGCARRACISTFVAPRGRGPHYSLPAGVHPRVVDDSAGRPR